MSWKNIFPRDVLIEYLRKRDYVFVVNEQFDWLAEKVVNQEEWRVRRSRAQKNFLQLILLNPKIFDLVYKFLNFIIKDRKNFKIKCSKGADISEVMTWEFRHREDKLLDLSATRERLGISREEFKNVLRLFFLASPELFLEDHREDGEKFNISPRYFDNLHYLSSTQAELDELYQGLSSNDSAFLEPWLKILI